MRHGFTGNTIVLPTEVRAEFDELLDDYIHDFSPETRFELDLVHELAATRWRLQRLWGMESTLLQIGMHRSEQTARAEFASALADNLVTTLAFIEMSGVRARCSFSIATSLASPSASARSRPNSAPSLRNAKE